MLLKLLFLQQLFLLLLLLLQVELQLLLMLHEAGLGTAGRRSLLLQWLWLWLWLWLRLGLHGLGGRRWLTLLRWRGAGVVLTNTSCRGRPAHRGRSSLRVSPVGAATSGQIFINYANVYTHALIMYACMLKILLSMSEFGGLWTHEKTRHAFFLLVRVG